MDLPFPKVTVNSPGLCSVFVSGRVCGEIHRWIPGYPVMLVAFFRDRPQVVSQLVRLGLFMLGVRSRQLISSAKSSFVWNRVQTLRLSCIVSNLEMILSTWQNRIGYMQIPHHFISNHRCQRTVVCPRAWRPGLQGKGSLGTAQRGSKRAGRVQKAGHTAVW